MYVIDAMIVEFRRVHWWC